MFLYEPSYCLLHPLATQNISVTTQILGYVLFAVTTRGFYFVSKLPNLYNAQFITLKTDKDLFVNLREFHHTISTDCVPLKFCLQYSVTPTSLSTWNQIVFCVRNVFLLLFPFGFYTWPIVHGRRFKNVKEKDFTALVVFQEIFYQKRQTRSLNAVTFCLKYFVPSESPKFSISSSQYKLHNFYLHVAHWICKWMSRNGVVNCNWILWRFHKGSSCSRPFAPVMSHDRDASEPLKILRQKAKFNYRGGPSKPPII